MQLPQPIQVIHVCSMDMYIGCQIHLNTSCTCYEYHLQILWCNLIERNLPPGGGFLFTTFPHQEPWVRGPPSKNLYQVFRGRSSYSRFLMREHSKYETPPGGFLSIKLPQPTQVIYVCWMDRYIGCQIHVYKLRLLRVQLASTLIQMPQLIYVMYVCRIFIYA